MFTRSIASLAFLVSCLVASSVLAQCGCGVPTTAYYAPEYTSYYAPTTAYYAPAYTSYYAPAPYTSYYAPAYTSYYAPAAAYYPAPYRAYYAPAYYGPRFYGRPWVRW